MKINMPYVIVTTLVDEEAQTVLFLESQSEESCKGLVPGKPLNAVSSVMEFTDNYMDITPVGIMDAMMELTGATHIWDDETRQIFPKHDPEE